MTSHSRGDETSASALQVVIVASLVELDLGTGCCLRKASECLCLI